VKLWKHSFTNVSKKYFKRTSMISINKDLVSKRNGVTFTEASDNVFEWGIRSFIFYFWVWMMSSTLGTYVSPSKNVRKITSNSFFCVFEYFLFHQLIIDCRIFMFSQKYILTSSCEIRQTGCWCKNSRVEINFW
jgi:hypothetical protein